MVCEPVGLPPRTQAQPEVHIYHSHEDELRSLEDFFGYDNASLVPDVTECRTILSIFVPPHQRGRGVGAALLRKECRRADSHGWWLIAHAYPWEVFERDYVPIVENYYLDHDFDIWRDRLVSFYQRAGFIHAGDGWCYRRPSRKK
jgi:GNAT superfamily N-acetyltransferase